MLTTEAHKEKVEEALSAGVSDYIVKPFNSEVIESKLRRILGSKYPTH
jgi:two-component system chemotaxis response regulator CheY